MITGKDISKTSSNNIEGEGEGNDEEKDEDDDNDDDFDPFAPVEKKKKIERKKVVRKIDNYIRNRLLFFL